MVCYFKHSGLYCLLTVKLLTLKRKDYFIISNSVKRVSDMKHNHYTIVPLLEGKVHYR